MKNEMPKYNELILPAFVALKELGGSGSNKEILEQVINDMELDENIIDIPHKNKYGSYQSELEYRLAWARSYLSISNVITSSARTIWTICPEYTNKETLTPDEIKEIIRKPHRNKKQKENISKNETNTVEELVEDECPWVKKLSYLLQKMDGFAFERFSKRLLRECGFSKLVVTKRTNDGGIDGFGEYKINGILTMKLAFQCKRYKNQVSAKDIRDFRGALTSDIERAILITTGTFTRSAIEEAAIPGKTYIDLMNGEELIAKIIELELGVTAIKTYDVDEEFFKSI